MKPSIKCIGINTVDYTHTALSLCARQQLEEKRKENHAVC